MRHKSDDPGAEEWLPDRQAWRVLLVAVVVGALAGVIATYAEDLYAGMLACPFVGLLVIGVLCAGSWLRCRRAAARYRRAWLRSMATRAGRKNPWLDDRDERHR